MKVSASAEDTQLAYSANIRVYPEKEELKKRVIQELHSVMHKRNMLEFH